MNKSTIVKIIAVLLVVLCAAGVGTYFYLNVDMTGESFADIEAYRTAHPNKTVTYTVTLEGDTPITLNESSSAAEITPSHADSLLAQADYLQMLTDIRVSGGPLPAAVVNRLTDAFPTAHITWESVSFLGNTYSCDTTAVNLSALSPDKISEAAEGLRALPMLETVDLCSGDGVSSLSLKDAAALHALYPEAEYVYRTELFGQVLSTDMERVEYFQADIGDAGLEQFRLLLPMMQKLNYLKLDWCGTSDEAMAQLRDDFADRIKVVWRVWFGYNFNALTDTWKIYIYPGLTDDTSGNLKYCTDVRYLDVGHNYITHCDWVQYMPELEVLIVAETKVKSIEPAKNCTKLTFLEIFNTDITDLSPLAALTNLEYLNFSSLNVQDISPIYNLNQLKHIQSVQNRIPDDQIAKFRELHPQCLTCFMTNGDPTSHGWRRDLNGRFLPRYALLRQQIGYDAQDFSRYPGGYLQEEITYESTGITPP